MEIWGIRLFSHAIPFLAVGSLLVRRSLTTVSVAKEHFGTYVRRARLAKELAQENLEAITGLSQSAICRIERGGREPSLNEACILCMALAMDLEWTLRKLGLWPG